MAIGVGIIGASPERGWAIDAHLPALAADPRFQVMAVSTTRMESARKTAELFDVPHAFASAQELAEHPDVDLVSVCVKVPDHKEAVTEVLRAGKHIYCEWPLATSATDAAEMADLAAGQGVQHLIGLQGRSHPTIRHVQSLVAEGYVGEVLSAALVGITWMGGPLVEPFATYGIDIANGMNVMTVPGGHSLDAACFCAGGEPIELSAQVATCNPRRQVEDSDEILDATAPDRIQMHALLDNGAALSVHLQGGIPGRPLFRLQIFGREGRLELRNRMHIQRGHPEILGARGDGEPTPISVPPGSIPELADFADTDVLGVARMYDTFARALDAGTVVSPGFDTAARRHRILDAMLESARAGQRVTISDGSASE